MDTQAECGTAELMCGAGEQCIDGRCFGECESDTDCSRREMCSGGVCVPGPLREVDTGGMDTTPPGPCDGIDCSGSPTLPVCHPSLMGCAQCVAGTDCSAAAPICDFGRGTCRAFDATTLCRPCNIDADCGAGGDTCRALAAERVCLPPCGDAGTCPRGLACDIDSMICEPTEAISCTAIYSALTSRACMADADCELLGGTATMGQCNVPAPGMPGICRQPCTDTSECPITAGCTEGFCVTL